MKKGLLGLIIGLAIISCDSKSEKNDDKLRDQALAACESEAITADMSEAKKEAIKQYCSCATEKMMDEFTNEELMQMSNPTKELQERLVKFVEPCLEELKMKTEK